MRPDKIHPMPERPMAGESSMGLDPEVKRAKSLMAEAVKDRSAPPMLSARLSALPWRLVLLILALFEPRHMFLHQFRKVMHFGQ
jgi:hypothetical protein